MINVLFALLLLLSASSVKADSEVITDTRAVSDKEVEMTKTVVQTVDVASLKRRLASINNQLQRLQDQKVFITAQIAAAKTVGVDPTVSNVEVISAP